MKLNIVGVKIIMPVITLEQNSQIMEYLMLVTHQLSIQLAKQLFIDKSGLVVHLQENTLVEEARAAGLTPLLIYSMNVEDMPLRYMQYASLDNPLSLAQFLKSAWSEDRKEGIPAFLKVSRTLFEQFPWLTDFTNRLGVEIAVADGKDRSFTANQIAAQGDSSSNHYFKTSSNENFRRRAPPTIEDMNDPRFFEVFWEYPIGSLSSMEEAELQAYLRATKCYIEPEFEIEAAWNTFPSEQDWLLKPQKNIPSRSLNLISHEIGLSLGKISWEVFDAHKQDEEDGVLDANEQVKKMLRCWPQPKSTVAKNIGVSLKEFDLYLSGKKGLDVTSFYRMGHYLQMYSNTDYQYEDGSPYFEFIGSYLLHGEKLAQVDDIFSELTGYDHVYKVEMLPDNHRPDPSFRFLLFGRELNFHIMVFNRASPAVSFLDDKKFYADRIDIPTKMYQDILRLYGEISRGEIHPAKLKENMLPWFENIMEINNQFDVMLSQYMRHQR